MKIYLNETVLDAAKKRINYLFDEFEDIIVWVSGGKDSTVIFNLTLEIAKERNRLPLKVGFIDQEAEWLHTIKEIKKIMYMKEVEPYWLQIPFLLTNSTSNETDFLDCWNPEKRDLWLRPQEPIAYTKNYYNAKVFHPIFEGFLNYHFKDKKIASISGVRCEESPTRFIALTQPLKYKNITWGKKYKNPNHFNFYPIYDWSYTDVWKAIFEHNWSYNKIYDYQYQKGVPVTQMRISSLHHETSLKAIFYMQEIEPENYTKLVRRLPGISTANQMGDDNYYIKKLPFMFKDWKEYRDYLLKHLISKEKQPKFKKWFLDLDLEFEHLNENNKIYIAEIQSIMANDIDMTKLHNLQVSLSTKETRKVREERRVRDYGKK